jgi:hypothetical protein
MSFCSPGELKQGVRKSKGKEKKRKGEEKDNERRGRG